jgi:hypothetical protein
VAPATLRTALAELKPRWSRGLGTIELLSSLIEIRQDLQIDMLRSERPLGWPALTGALCGSFLGANNLVAAGCAVDDTGLKTANSVTHVNPPHCRRGKAVQLMHNFDG